MRDMQARPAEKQVQAVSKKLSQTSSLARVSSRLTT